MLFIEPLVAWGVVDAVGFVFKPIMEKFASLAIDTLEDCVKDFFGVCIQDKLDLAKNISLKIAFGRSKKEFLGLLQQEFEDNDIQKDEMLNYLDDLSTFLSSKPVLEELGKAFKESLGVPTYHQNDLFVNPTTLLMIWNNLNLKPLPEGFNWQRLVKRYKKKVDYILLETDKLRELLDSQNLSRIREEIEQNTPINANFDLRRYQSNLLNAYSKLKLESLDTSGYSYSLDLWKIFVPQRMQQQEVTPANIFFVSDIFNDRQNYRYTVILGNPGSGKSTLSQYIALQWAKTPSSSLELQELPLLIELRNYTENQEKSRCRNFLEYFAQGSGVLGGTLNQKELNEWLKTHESIVIFDGLDEILDQGKRKNVTIDIINFTTTYPKARVLVTSRVVGYEQQRHRFRDANFIHFMLQDLDQGQIEGFITQWHDLVFLDQYEKKQKSDRLLKCIQKPTFKELAGNPLLLTMMAILNRHEELPRDRATLYEHASEVLLQKWDAERKYLPDHTRLEYHDKKEMLREIAFKILSDAIKSANSLIITKENLETILNQYLEDKKINNAYLQAKSLREHLTNRSFILCFLGGNSYGFVHRTFLEYFCALYFLDKYQHEQTMSLDQLKEEVIINRWTNETWHEVIVLLTGLIHESFAAELIDCLAEQDGQPRNFDNLILAAECLQNVRNRYPVRETDKRLLDRIKDLVDNQPLLTDEIRNKAIAVIKTTWTNDFIKTTWTDDSETLQWLAALDQ
ncbi:NACHT domain-containing protein [Calothrix sp. 336/3]|uniref:NACHT domain-containing protein n=1 Tax=Calothrix sp. 336/3 TaxID=1337936 RepID=UPI000699DA07|nr:NACHT domain-containing protein [Calothrix sp. 336/3]